MKLTFIATFCLTCTVHGITIISSVSTGYEYTDEDVSDAAPMAASFESYEEDDADDSKGNANASVQFMITNRMRRVLEDELNYLEEEIDLMDPQIASVVIERGLARPLTGMPKSWHKILPTKPLLSDLRIKIADGTRKMMKGVKYVVRKVLPIALPVAGVVLVLPSVFNLVKLSSAMTKEFVTSTYEKSSNRRKLARASQKAIPEEKKIVKKAPVKAVVVNDIIDVKANNRVDMKTLNSVNRPLNFFEKLLIR